MLHAGRVVMLLASRLVLPVLAIATVGGAFLLIANSDDMVSHGELDSEFEESWSLCIKCNSERDRMRKELLLASLSGEPVDLAAIAAYDAIRDEYFRRAQMDRIELYEWYLEQVQGKSIYELRRPGK